MNEGIAISLTALQEYVVNVFGAVGMQEDNAAVMADVIVRCTMYHRGHHDAGFIPNLVGQIAAEKAPANPQITCTASRAAIESWDGDNGLGPICCTKAMERAMELAQEYGMGMCCMRRTNHFLAAGPYVELAASQGFIGLMLAKGGVTMGAPGYPGDCMSALPMGFAYPTEQEPVMLDACMAYASLEKLRVMGREGKVAPNWWGYGKDGQPSEDPLDILAGTRLPIGGHKGFGLAMLGEVLTGVLSNGCIMDEKITEDGVVGATSHTAIAIKADTLMDADTFRRRAGSIGVRASELSEGLHIPGQGAAKQVSLALESNTVMLGEGEYLKLNELAAEYGVKLLDAI